ncbi:MAG TPA: hypothetical protein VFU37_21335, partial [Pyrinomonadaceae bacterium]|nr:hypothetical protein [Pyrinomonadaceae bacterium]
SFFCSHEREQNWLVPPRPSCQLPIFSLERGLTFLNVTGANQTRDNKSHATKQAHRLLVD